MSQSRVINFVVELPPKVKEKFRNFVHSPYFNQHDKTKELLDAIMDWDPKPNEKEIDRQFLFKQIFPDQKFDEQKLFNVMSYLKKLFQKFIAYQSLEKNELKEQLLVLEGASEEGQTALFNNRSKVLERKLKDTKVLDASFYNFNYHLNRLKLKNYEDEEELNRSKMDLLRQMAENFDLYYIAEKLRIAVDLTSFAMSYNANFDLEFTDYLLDILKKNWDKYENCLVIKIYYYIYYAQTTAEPFYFSKLKEILKKDLPLLNEQEKKYLFSAASNFCIQKINQRINEYRNELFLLYQQGLESGILISNNILSESNYKNITTLGCVLGEFDWTEKFLNDYSALLPEDKRENAYSYNMANYLFYKEEYDKAQTVLVNVQFKDFKYHINATILLMRTYYKIGDTEALLQVIETFRIFLMRNKDLPHIQKKGYSNYLRFKKRLAVIKNSAHILSSKEYAEKMNSLKQAIEKTDYVYNTDWLLTECKT